MNTQHWDDHKAYGHHLGVAEENRWYTDLSVSEALIVFIATRTICPNSQLLLSKGVNEHANAYLMVLPERSYGLVFFRKQ